MPRKQVPPGWPYLGSGKPPSDAVRIDPDKVRGGRRRLRILLRKAQSKHGRNYGGAINLDGREYSVAQLTAALKKAR